MQPPTIAVFGNNPDLVQEHYIRYLHNGFRESWRFTGSPLRIVMRRKAAEVGGLAMEPIVAVALSYLSGSIPFA